MHSIPAAIDALFVALGVTALTQGFIDNKATAMALFLLALVFRRKWTSGILYGSSFLIAQQILLGAPAAIWWVHHHSNRRMVGQVAVAAIVTVLIGYLSVGIAWGVEALVAVFQQAMMLAGGYATETSQFQTNGSLISSFNQYYQYTPKRVEKIQLLLIRAGLGLGRAVYNRKGRNYQRGIRTEPCEEESAPYSVVRAGRAAIVPAPTLRE